jgi:hypothetical protein
MTTQEEILLEEVLIAYLKSNKKVILDELIISKYEDRITLNVQFNIPESFGTTLIKSLDNIFKKMINEDKK